jgi:hypothetical protein
MLVDGLGLPFQEVSTQLNSLRDQDPQWWVLGKLNAYRAQTQAFVHIDSDVFLWNALPFEVSAAGVFAQNPEPFVFSDDSWFRPAHYDTRARENGGWLPEEWRWYVDRRGAEVLCCGVLGGQRADFISHYAEQAIRMMTHPVNQRLWEKMSARIRDNVLFEEYLLSACIAYHGSNALSPYRDALARHVFASNSDLQQQARAIGYTHLSGGAKKHLATLRRLEQRVARDYPAQYANCLRYLRSAA